MTDFLDQLEHDLYEAAQRRGRRSYAGPMRLAVAATVAVAILASGVWAIDNPGRGHVADRAVTPADIDTNAPVTVYENLGDTFEPRLGRFGHALEQRGYNHVSPPSAREVNSDYDYAAPTAVYFRPGAEATAADVARRLHLHVTPKPLTDHDDRRIFGATPPRHDAQVLVFIGNDDKMIAAMVELAECQDSGRLADGPLMLCNIEKSGRVVIDQGDRFELDALSLALPLPDDMVKDRRYAWAAASPDGQSYLLQLRWRCNASCSNAAEAFIAFPDWTHRAQPVGGDDGHTKDTLALGWTTDARAITLAADDTRCGGRGSSGIYLVRPDGDRGFVGCVDSTEPPQSLQPSIHPRTPEAVERAVP